MSFSTTATIVLVVGAVAIVGVHLGRNSALLRISPSGPVERPKEKLHADDVKPDETKLNSYQGYNAPGKLRRPVPAPRAVAGEKVVPFMREMRSLHYIT